jgi:hypothetical protein
MDDGRWYLVYAHRIIPKTERMTKGEMHELYGED